MRRRRSMVLGLSASLGLMACGPAASPSAPAPSAASSAPSASGAIAASGTPSPSASPRPTPTPLPSILPGESWLAVQTQTTGYGVHFVRPDGTGLHRWTAGVPGTHEHPDWSPDGDRILLNAVMPDGTEDLWIGAADGSDAQMLLDCVAPCVWLDEAAWSPDGTEVAVQRLTRGAGRQTISTLERLEVATGRTTIILTMPTQEIVLAPRWAPDGRRLVVEHLHLVEDHIDADVDRGGIGIVDLDAATPTVQPITEGAFENSPDWSPGGELVLWSQPGAEGGSDVWVGAPDGSGARRVTDLASSGDGADQPAFAPDGRSIVFVWSEAGGSTRIGQVDVDGSGLRSATGDVEIDGMHPRLRPVGGSDGGG
jgi:Tol biopolymer transport system component